MSSIRKRLLVLLLGLWTTVWIAIALITLDRSGHEVSELLDAQLAQTAQVLLQITEADTRQDPVISPQASSPMLHPYESKIGFQLWRKGKLISSFGAAPGATLAQMPGYSDQDIGGTQWRIFGLTVGQPNEILFVGQSYSIRQELIEFLTLHALQPILWSLPLTVLLLWLAVSDGLRPLQRLARDIGGRSAERLLPVDESMVPTEVRPLTNALNRLMEQLEQALSAERRFAADASHELRTPLAVIRTHAQIAQRSKDPRERSEALEQLIQGVDRATHLVSQLLTLARLVPSTSETEPGTWSLCDTLAQVVEDKRRLARAKSRSSPTRTPARSACIPLCSGSWSATWSPTPSSTPPKAGGFEFRPKPGERKSCCGSPTPVPVFRRWRRSAYSSASTVQPGNPSQGRASASPSFSASVSCTVPGFGCATETRGSV
jgi:HAMP domain-containing protein